MIFELDSHTMRARFDIIRQEMNVVISFRISKTFVPSHPAIKIVLMHNNWNPTQRVCHKRLVESSANYMLDELKLQLHCTLDMRIDA